MQTIPRGLKQVIWVLCQRMDKECSAGNVEGCVSEGNLRRQCRPGLRCWDCIARNRKYWNNFWMNIKFYCTRMSALGQPREVEPAVERCSDIVGVRLHVESELEQVIIGEHGRAITHHGARKNEAANDRSRR